MRKAAVLIPLAGVVLASLAPVSGHGEAQEVPGIRAQWENSPHAMSMDEAGERERMNRTGCAHCHTAQGYQEVFLQGAESTAPYEDPEGLTCIACHEPGEGSGRVGGLKAGAARDACRGCHDEIVANRPEYLSWCSQWGIFDGAGGSEIPGRDYGSSSHSGLENACAYCHMAPAAQGVDAGRVGGHTFRVKTKGVEPELFNPEPCRPCHGEMTLEALKGSQDGVRQLLVKLAALLPQKPTPEDSAVLEPKYPSDPSLDEIQQRASFNYWLVQKDGSFGVHNPVYTWDLLLRSTKELEERNAMEAVNTPGSEAGTRIDHIIWAAPELMAGVEEFSRLSGVDPAVGGSHPGRGTRNYLASAGSGTYIEIIAPDPDQMPFDPTERPVQAFAEVISGMDGPEVDMFVFSAPDLEALADLARGLGLEVVGPSPGERRTPEGKLIRWSHVDFLGHDFGQFIPFAINWLDSTHPSETSPQGVGISGVVVEHPRADELRQIYQALGVPAEVVQAERARIRVGLQGVHGSFELTSGASLMKYYAVRSTKNIK